MATWAGGDKAIGKPLTCKARRRPRLPHASTNLAEQLRRCMTSAPYNSWRSVWPCTVTAVFRLARSHAAPRLLSSSSPGVRLRLRVGLWLRLRLRLLRVGLMLRLRLLRVGLRLQL